ncbi:hypothetical protein MHU86_22647 [Fragilaria crotonensis]|nr:hypothetical protein MHU86_22647 [Fragilaria crotonensis]
MTSTAYQVESSKSFAKHKSAQMQKPRRASNPAAIQICQLHGSRPSHSSLSKVKRIDIDHELIALMKWLSLIEKLQIVGQIVDGMSSPAPSPSWMVPPWKHYAMTNSFAQPERYKALIGTRGNECGLIICYCRGMAGELKATGCSHRLTVAALLTAS